MSLEHHFPISSRDSYVIPNSGYTPFSGTGDPTYNLAGL